MPTIQHDPTSHERNQKVFFSNNNNIQWLFVLSLQQYHYHLQLDPNHIQYHLLKNNQTLDFMEFIEFMYSISGLDIWCLPIEINKTHV